jgi:regulatory protein
MEDSDAESAEAIREQCIRLLARREHTRRELVRKLSVRGFEPTVFESVLNALEEENLLSEARFTEAYVRSRLESGYGPLRIRASLLERGVASTLIADALDIGEDTWRAYCQAAWQRRFGSPPADRQQWAKQSRFLANRGFNGDHIRGVLERAGHNSTTNS